jgi:hypothetical protein
MQLPCFEIAEQFNPTRVDNNDEPAVTDEPPAEFDLLQQDMTLSDWFDELSY